MGVGEAYSQLEIAPRVDYGGGDLHSYEQSIFGSVELKRTLQLPCSVDGESTPGSLAPSASSSRT